MKFLTAALALVPAVMAMEPDMSWMPRSMERDASPQLNPHDKHVRTESYWQGRAKSESKHLCFIRAAPDEGDSGPIIEKALNEECKSKAIIVFPDEVYHIKTTMNTTVLQDVSVNQFGRLLWSDDIEHWLNTSMPIDFQNQSTVWYMGGDHVLWDGYGAGTFDGNGEAWYVYIHGQGNYPRRPMMVNYRGLNNSVVRNMRYVQSQMWTMATTYSNNVLFEDIYVNNTSPSGASTLNTDGIDTIYSDNLVFRRWSVTNGDDSIALKDNSTNIFVYDSEFWNGQGFAVGSIGQYEGKFSTIENFYVKNVTGHNVNYACYLKTWPGVRDGYPPNGGGGGLGYARNILLEDITLDQSRGTPIYFEQCENYEGHELQHCNTSKFHLEDVIWRNIGGTVVDKGKYAGNFLCSPENPAGGCSNITVENFTVTPHNSTEVLDIWHCENVVDYHGFNCTAGSSRP